MSNKKTILGLFCILFCSLALSASINDTDLNYLDLESNDCEDMAFMAVEAYYENHPDDADGFEAGRVFELAEGLCNMLSDFY